MEKKIIVDLAFEVDDEYQMTIYVCYPDGEEYIAGGLDLSQQENIAELKKQLDKEIAEDKEDWDVYCDFYDLALDELHLLGYVLAGEVK